MKMTLKVEKEFDAKTLQVQAAVRYWEDSQINGVSDTGDGDNIPLKKGDSWNLSIDLETGKIANWPKVTASIHYKVCDAGNYSLLDGNNEVIAERNWYVPDCLCPEASGYGDYIIMDINEEGYIQGWNFDPSYAEFWQPED